MAINFTQHPGRESSSAPAGAGGAASFMKRAIDANKALSWRLDAYFTGRRKQRHVLREFISEIEASELVADVGGGKKPAKLLAGFRGPVGSRYDGFDLDSNELLQAQDLYSSIYELDITNANNEFLGRYDKIICKSTLEHVIDAEKAMFGLSSMLREGGRLYVNAPHRYAAFAVLNRFFPHEVKRRMLHYIFPNKIGDGFPAHYLGCTIAAMERNANRCNLYLVQGSVNKFYTSSYFTFFVPLFLLWRIVTAFQYALYDGYCERFEMVFEKRSPRVSE